VEQRIMDAAGVQAKYDSEVNDRDQVFVDCMDTHANTEQRHGRPSDTEETDPCRSACRHSWRPHVGLVRTEPRSDAHLHNSRPRSSAHLHSWRTNSVQLEHRQQPEQRRIGTGSSIDLQGPDFSDYNSDIGQPSLQQRQSHVDDNQVKASANSKTPKRTVNVYLDQHTARRPHSPPTESIGQGHSRSSEPTGRQPREVKGDSYMTFQTTTAIIIS